MPGLLRLLFALGGGGVSVSPLISLRKLLFALGLLEYEFDLDLDLDSDSDLARNISTASTSAASCAGAIDADASSPRVRCSLPCPPPLAKYLTTSATAPGDSSPGLLRLTIWSRTCTGRIGSRRIVFADGARDAGGGVAAAAAEEEDVVFAELDRRGSWVWAWAWVGSWSTKSRLYP